MNRITPAIANPTVLVFELLFPQGITRAQYRRFSRGLRARVRRSGLQTVDCRGACFVTSYRESAPELDLDRITPWLLRQGAGCRVIVHPPASLAALLRHAPWPASMPPLIGSRLDRTLARIAAGLLMQMHIHRVQQEAA